MGRNLTLIDHRIVPPTNLGLPKNHHFATGSAHRAAQSAALAQPLSAEPLRGALLQFRRQCETMRDEVCGRRFQ